MSPLTRRDLKRIFEKLDTNRDGLVSLDELNRLLRGIGAFQLGPAELESLAQGKTAMDFNDFVLFYDTISRADAPPEPTEPSSSCDDLAAAFRVFDLNGDGFISCDELRSVLVRLGLMEETSCGRDCKGMIGAFDANSDGQLDFEEFKNMMLLTN